VPYEGASPRRGDIVVVETPQRAGTVCGSRGLFVKRVIGLPGEAWSERKGFVYINGRRLAEAYVAPDHRDGPEAHARRYSAPPEANADPAQDVHRPRR